ncbi:MAG TPA: SipW-dependent-type signal peptide-containing protein [Acidimicrobiales bacterium]|nr:SipW-dependent-type signal peptide-containing protein [Acidimicrobiales bacterium]
MLRRIATMALVLGSAAALLVGGATYAPFTDDAEGAGPVGAGNVNVSINGTDSATFAFDSDECSNMAPGIDCVVPFDASAGSSSLSATWTTTITEDGDEALDGLPDGCFTEEVSVPVGDAEQGDADADHDPGDSHDGTLTVRIADDNRCQSAATGILVKVVATQSPSPHN